MRKADDFVFLTACGNIKTLPAPKTPYRAFLGRLKAFCQGSRKKPHIIRKTDNVIYVDFGWYGDEKYKAFKKYITTS